MTILLHHRFTPQKSIKPMFIIMKLITLECTGQFTKLGLEVGPTHVRTIHVSIYVHVGSPEKCAELLNDNKFLFSISILI